MYVPAVGRFTSEDPAGFVPGDPNLYRYVGNNPTNATDPSGLQKETIPNESLPNTLPEPQQYHLSKNEKGFIVPHYPFPLLPKDKIKANEDFQLSVETVGGKVLAGSRGAFFWGVNWQISGKKGQAVGNGLIIQHIKITYDVTIGGVHCSSNDRLMDQKRTLAHIPPLLRDVDIKNSVNNKPTYKTIHLVYLEAWPVINGKTEKGTTINSAMIDLNKQDDLVLPRTKFDDMYAMIAMDHLFSFDKIVFDNKTGHRIVNGRFITVDTNNKEVLANNRVNSSGDVTIEGDAIFIQDARPGSDWKAGYFNLLYPPTTTESITYVKTGAGGLLTTGLDPNVSSSVTDNHLRDYLGVAIGVNLANPNGHYSNHVKRRIEVSWNYDGKNNYTHATATTVIDGKREKLDATWR